MNTTVNEVLQFIRENDVKFIRLGFCDIFGLQKNISIMPDELAQAFEYGISFDASAIRGFQDVTKSDLLLVPDPATLTVLPWRPGPGRVVRFYCDIRNPDGSPFVRDCRYLLKRIVGRCESMGYVCKIGAECEFDLFKTDEDGRPTEVTLDNGGYLDISPLDKGENIRREICLCLEEMGIKPESSHHEQGPGQVRLILNSDALTCADNMVTFKSVVKAIAARNGLFALHAEAHSDAPGSGFMSTFPVAKRVEYIQGSGAGIPIFPGASCGHTGENPEITLFLNPLCNS